MQSKLKRRPFLKWAGGKYRVVEQIIPHLPESTRLIEPFVGAGAIFLNTDYKRYLLNDINPDLINLFNTVKDKGEAFIRDAEKLFRNVNNNEKRYYSFRQAFNQSQCSYERSLIFLYLNRHGYNGLCRYSRKNGFNVPFGRYAKPYFPAVELEYFHEKAQRAVFTCCDFKTAMLKARKGNIVYCDPPYVPLSRTASFTQYAQVNFSLSSQRVLAETAERLMRRDVRVVISNHDNELTRELYSGAKALNYFKVQRNISRDGATRNPAKEVLAIYS